MPGLSPTTILAFFTVFRGQSHTFPLFGLKIVPFDHTCRVACDHREGRNILRHDGIRRHHAMLSDGHTRQDMASERQPTSFPDHNRSLVYDGLLADRKGNILITMRMVCDMDKRGEEHIILYGDGIGGGYPVVGAKIHIVSHYDLGRIIRSHMIVKGTKSGALIHHTMVAEIDVLRMEEEDILPHIQFPRIVS